MNPGIPLRHAPAAWLRTTVALLGWLTLTVAPASRAQEDSSRAHAQIPDSARRSAGAARLRWPMLAGAVAIAAVEDERLSAFARSHQSAGLDRLATSLDPLGRAGILVPALAAAVIVPRAAGRRALSDAALRTALTYAAADGMESILKPLIGRHRPADAGGAWRFHPLSNDGDWHSTPSAHTVHVVSIATGLALESRSTWVAAPAYLLASLVGMQRVYLNQHWTSDVVTSAALAALVGRWTEERLRRRGLPHILRPLDAPD